MGFLLISILCSVSVSVLLKFAKPKGIDLAVAIAVNYIVCIFLTFLLLQPVITGEIVSRGLPLFVALGLLLPSVFLIMGKSAQVAGIVKSDTAQRVALVIPLIASFTIFGEAFSAQKGIGLVLIFLAMACLLYQKNTHAKMGIGNQYQAMLLLVGVFFGYGIISVLLKQLAKMGGASTSNLFISFILAFVFMAVYVLIKKIRVNQVSLIGGLLLGGLNFTNIYTYIAAHKAMADTPTTVFAVMDIGVIVGGTLAGFVIFKERINMVNAFGIVIALIAIGQLYLR